MGDIEKHSLSVKQLLSARGVSAELAKRIQEADVDGNGEISIEELVVVLQSEQKAKQDVKLFRNIVILLVVCLIILIAATAGVTYGMVYALKDTNVNNGVMQAKGTNIPVSTGAVTNATDLRSLYLVPSLQELVSIDKIVLAAPDNASVAVYHVASIDLVPGVSATINTTDGQTIIVDSSGIHGVSVSPTGRRLLFSFGSIGSTLGGIGSTLSGGLNNLGNTITGLGNNLGNEITGSITNLGNDITGAVGTISNFATNSFNTVESGIKNFITLVQNAINGANPCCGAESGLQQAVAQLNAVYPNATAAVNQVTSLVNQYSSYASEICANSQVQSLISTVNNIVTKLDGALNQGGSNGLGSLIKQAIASTQCCQVVNSYIGQLKTIDSNFHTLQSDLSSACPPAVVAG